MITFLSYGVQVELAKILAYSKVGSFHPISFGEFLLDVDSLSFTNSRTYYR